MPTVADLLVLPCLHDLGDETRSQAFQSFVDAYDKTLGEAMQWRDLASDHEFKTRLSIQVLLRLKPDEDDDALCRMHFDGVPFSLIRCGRSGTNYESGKRVGMTVRLTDRATADKLVEACHARLAELDCFADRLTEVSGTDEVADLLDFGPGTEADIVHQTVLVRQQTRLMYLSVAHRPHMVLNAIEGGGFVVGVRDEPSDVFREHKDAADAFTDFDAVMTTMAAEVTKQTQPLLILRTKDSIRTLGFITGNRGPVCNVVEDGSREVVYRTIGENAMPTFISTARNMMRQTLGMEAVAPAP